MSIYLGIDPGASGGIAVVSEINRICDAWPMPEDEVQIFAVIRDISRAYTLSCAALEQVTGWMPGKEGAKHGGAPGSHMFNFGRSYGLLRGFLIALGIPFIDVAPRTWQKRVGAPEKAGKTYPQHKKALCEYARSLFPAIRITLKSCDALLIAEYCRLTYT